MRRRRNRKNQRAVILGTTIALLGIMSVGYAAFQTNITLNAKGNIKQSGVVTTDDLKNNVKTENGDGEVASDGLYQDPTEPDRYIYRGAEPDNYITFNDEEWRIVAIESDGAIKIMKNPTEENLVTPKAFDTNGQRNTGYCEQGAAQQYGCNVWAQNNSFTSANEQFTGAVDKDSEMKTYLNNDYYNTITTNKDAIQEHDFYYGSVTWESEDLSAQVTEEKKASTKSNVGLIQASDYIKSNTNTAQCGTFKQVRDNYASCKNTSWMVKGLTSKWYWTLSPNGNDNNTVLHVGTDGRLTNHYANGTSGYVAPTLYLTPGIQLNGKGTQNSPYTIIEEKS